MSNIPAVEPGEIVTTTVLEPTTIGELLNHLPHSRKVYRFHPSNMGTMKKLGVLEQDKQLRKRPGQYMAHFLAAALAELDGQNMGLAGDHKEAPAVMALPAGDVFCLMLAWKRQCSPKGASLGAGACGRQGCIQEFGEITVDLGEISVLALPEGAEQPACSVGLFTGFPFPRPGDQVRTVILQPAPWATTFGALNAAQFANSGHIASALFQASIVAVDTTPAGRVSVEALDEMTQEDADLINGALDLITPTPSMAVEVDCPLCQHTNTLTFDWRELGFLSGPQKR